MRISDWSSDVCSSDLGPSVPVEVLGLSGVPSAGDIFTVVENDARAREVAAYRQSVLDKKRTATAPVNLENMFAAKGDQPVEFQLVVKARSEERRVGKECGSTGRSRWSPDR